MKKFSTLLFTFLIAATAWASNQDRLTPAAEKTADAPQITTVFWAEQQINDLKATGSDIPEHLYRLVREHYGLPIFTEPAARQGGDTVGEATVIDELPYSDTGTTVGYTDDYDEVCPYTGSDSPDVVYSFTPGENVALDITLCTGSDYDTKLYIYENDVTPGSPYACNDDTCPGYVSELMDLGVTGGNTYYIVIDGYSGDAGNYTLDITEDVYVDPPPNDTCEDAEEITGPYPVTVSGTVEGSTIDCAGLLNWYAVWYTIELPYDMQTVTIDWCESPDTPYISNYGIIYMDDCLCDDYVPGTYGWDCANENLILSWSGVAGPTTIYFPCYIEGATDFTITVDVESFEPSGGDACIEPLVVDSLPYEFFGTTTDNTNTYGNAAPDEWHLFNVYEDGPYVFTLCGGGTNYDSYLYLLDGDCATELASNDDFCGLQSEMMVTLSPGEYVLAVDGYSSSSGDYQLEIYGETPPEYGNCQYPPHTPDDGWSAGTSHNNGVDADYLRADRFGDAGNITGFVIAGLSLVYNAGWSTCFEDPMSFAVTFYEDGGMPGAEVCNYVIDASPEATGDSYAGYPLYEFTLDLPTPCDLESGWFSVQTSGECWFLWMSTGSGYDDWSALSTSGGGWTVYAFDNSWCLILGEDVTELDTPHAVTLQANHPNPFNPVTTISYELAAPQQVELVVFNVSGEMVATLVNDVQTAGLHTQQFDGSNLPSGIYFYRLNTGDFSQTKRMLLVK